MIDLYFWTTPNGMKPLILLEESGLEYTVRPVNISKGEQFAEAFMRISPNQKIPAMIDTAPASGNAPVATFESGAILQYVAEKADRFLPKSLQARTDAMQWLFWQMSGLGPTLGQFVHFSNHANEAIPYAQGRFSREKERLYTVLDQRLRDREFIASDYSIADIATFPWIHRLEQEGDHLNGFASIQRWHDMISRRPAVKRAYARAAEINTTPTVTEASRTILFGTGPSMKGK
ncbi:MAG: glutathione S-transferase N-terminal domain-containing protein [Hyphomicrobiaceae bacterium]